MTVPFAKTKELDGSLGIRPPLTGLPLVVVGQCTAGPLDSPAAFARVQDVVANFGNGRAPEAACYAIERFGVRVIMVRTDTSVVHAYSAVDDTGMVGTSVPTVVGTNVPNDDYEAVVRFITGGTIGAAGITYQWSLDGGRTFSPIAALGTATSIALTGTGSPGVVVNLAAGTIVAGDELSFTATAEMFDATDLAAALAALANSSLLWEFAEIAGALDATTAGTVSAALTALHNAGKHHWAIGNFRGPNAGETEAQYLTAWGTAFSAFADASMAIGAGVAKVESAISRRTYRRPVALPVAALAASLSEEVDLAAIDIGRLPGVTIRDANGNPDPGYHDETVNAGLDDARALVLRTWDGETGVYVNNPRLISAAGSDFDFLQKRRVMNLARADLNAYMRRRLSKPITVSKKTGFITESEALSIEAAANQRMERLLLKKPKASSVRVVLSRTDDILNAPYPLTGELRMAPLAYPKEITMEASWVAVQVTT